MAKNTDNERMIPVSEVEGFRRAFNTDAGFTTHQQIKEIMAATHLNKRQIFEQAIEEFHKAKVG